MKGKALDFPFFLSKKMHKNAAQISQLNNDRIVLEGALQEAINLDPTGFSKVLEQFNVHLPVTPKNVAEAAANHPQIKKELFYIVSNAEGGSTESFNDQQQTILGMANKAVQGATDKAKKVAQENQAATTGKQKFTWTNFENIVDGLGRTFEQINIFAGKGVPPATDLQNNNTSKPVDDNDKEEDPDPAVPKKLTKNVIIISVVAVVAVVAIGLIIRKFSS